MVAESMDSGNTVPEAAAVDKGDAAAATTGATGAKKSRRGGKNKKKRAAPPEQEMDDDEEMDEDEGGGGPDDGHAAAGAILLAREPRLRAKLEQLRALAELGDIGAFVGAFVPLDLSPDDQAGYRDDLKASRRRRRRRRRSSATEASHVVPLLTVG